MSATCNTCRYYSSTASPAKRCLRYPPVYVEAYTDGQWPGTQPSYWCGEYCHVEETQIQPSFAERRAMGVAE